MKALTLVASSCNSDSYYLGEGSLYVHTQNAFLFAQFYQYWQFPTWKGNKRVLFLRLWDNYCLVDIWHPFLYPDVMAERCLFLSLFSWDWPWPVPSCPIFPHYQSQLQMAQRGMTWRACAVKGKENSTVREVSVLFTLSVFVIVRTNLLRVRQNTLSFYACDRKLLKV